MELGYRYHKPLKTLTELYNSYEVLKQKHGCKFKTLQRQAIAHLTFYGIIYYKANKLKNDPLNQTVPLNKLIY